MERSIMLIHGQRLTKAQRSSAFHNGTGFVQLQTNKFQGLFKVFSRTNYSFQRLRVFLINWHLTPLGKTPHGVIYEFYFFGHRWSHYFILLSATRLCKITGYDLQLHLRYRNSIWNKIMFMYKNVFTLNVSFTGSYNEDEPNFPQQNNLILQKKVTGVDKAVNFKDFSRPYKK